MLDAATSRPSVIARAAEPPQRATGAATPAAAEPHLEQARGEERRPPSGARGERLISTPIVNSRITTPISARDSTASVSVTSPSPWGPRSTPASEEPHDGRHPQAVEEQHDQHADPVGEDQLFQEVRRHGVARVLPRRRTERL